MVAAEMCGMIQQLNIHEVTVFDMWLVIALFKDILVQIDMFTIFQGIKL